MKHISLDLRLALTTTIVLGFSISAKSDLLFEGYYKVLSAGVPVGYFVQNYEYEEKSQQFISRYLLTTNQLGGNIKESLVARADQKFHPISYQYTSHTGGEVKTIDANFTYAEVTGEGKNLKVKPPAAAKKSNKKNKTAPKDSERLVMQATITDGKKPNTIESVMPKGTFLSTFLAYLMMQKGISVDTKFDYSAVAEEDGNSYDGQALVKEKIKESGQDAYKIANNFKGTKFTSVMTSKGDVLSTKSPLQQIDTVLVANAAEATTGFPYDATSLRLVFGRIPDGKLNIVAKLNQQKLDSIKGTSKNKNEITESTPTANLSPATGEASNSTSENQAAPKAGP